MGFPKLAGRKEWGGRFGVWVLIAILGLAIGTVVSLTLLRPRPSELLVELKRQNDHLQTVTGRVALLESQLARSNELLSKQIDYLSTSSSRLANVEGLMRSLTRQSLEGNAAAGLKPGEARVTGVRGDIGRVIPIVIGANFPDATSVRLGNTIEELERAPWRANASTLPWKLAAGKIAKQVHIEWKDSAGPTTRLAVRVPAYDSALGFDYELAPIRAYDPRIDADGIVMNFDTDDEHWVSYANDGKVVPSSNVFYPVTWMPSGGARGGYVWTDSSRWMIDTPETPHSVLALMTYGKWSTSCAAMKGSMEFSFLLRGEQLDLKGGEVLFWVTVGGKARFHQTSRPLALDGNDWTRHSVAVGPDRNGWRRSWSRGGEQVDFDTSLGIDSFGLSIVGFRHADMPSGALAIDEVRVAPGAGFECSPRA